MALKECSQEVDRLADMVGRRMDLYTAVYYGCRSGMLLLGTLLGLFLSWMISCASIGHEKVEGWPELKVYEHHVPHNVMRDKCAKYTAFGSYPEACSEFNLAEKRCDIYFSADFPPTKAFIEHERMHCLGYDHEGETGMRDFLENYRRAYGSLESVRR